MRLFLTCVMSLEWVVLIGFGSSGNRIQMSPNMNASMHC